MTARVLLPPRRPYDDLMALYTMGKDYARSEPERIMYTEQFITEALRVLRKKHHLSADEEREIVAQVEAARFTVERWEDGDLLRWEFRDAKTVLANNFFRDHETTEFLFQYTLKNRQFAQLIDLIEPMAHLLALLAHHAVVPWKAGEVQMDACFP